MLVFDVKVVPSAGRQGWELEQSGRLKVLLKSAPEKNKANLELIKLLAKVLQVPQLEVEIVAGGISRYKRVRVATNLTYAELLSRLGLAHQQTLFGE